MKDRLLKDILVLLGMMVIIVIICGFLWRKFLFISMQKE